MFCSPYKVARYGFAALLLWIWSVFAIADTSPYYTLNHTWALGADVKETLERNIYPRNAFLPSRYLLYIDDRSKTYLISKESFVRATTQDGVEVYVLEKHVSRKPFNISVGTHEIIFNSAYHLCNIKPCSNPKEENIFPISRGDAFTIIEQAGGYYKVKGGKEEPIVGYITEQVLEESVQHGMITRTDDRHPRYRISKHAISSISLSCGEKLQSVKQINEDELVHVKFIAKSFGLGFVDTAKEQLKLPPGRVYGQTNQALDFFVYSVSDIVKNEDFKVAAVFTIHCENKDFKGPRNLYFESVTFKSSRLDEPVQIKVDDFTTPTDLRDYTGAPYLISINEYSHFESAVKKLSEKVGDRTLAGFALSEINVSCRFSERRNKNSKCRSYSY